MEREELRKSLRDSDSLVLMEVAIFEKSETLTLVTADVLYLLVLLDPIGAEVAVSRFGACRQARQEAMLWKATGRCGWVFPPGLSRSLGFSVLFRLEMNTM